MYKNVGAKIKAIVKLFTWISIIICIAIGGFLIYISKEYDIIIGKVAGWILIIVGPLYMWLNSLMIYAFGEIAEDVESIKKEFIKKECMKKEVKNKVSNIENNIVKYLTK